jgi:hypothetical protein
MIAFHNVPISINVTANVLIIEVCNNTRTKLRPITRLTFTILATYVTVSGNQCLLLLRRSTEALIVLSLKLSPGACIADRPNIRSIT